MSKRCIVSFISALPVCVDLFSVYTAQTLYPIHFRAQACLCKRHLRVCLHRAITSRRSHAAPCWKISRNCLVRRVGSTAGVYSDAPCRRAEREHGNGHYTPTDCAECLFVRCFTLGTRGGGHVFSAPAIGCGRLGRNSSWRYTSTWGSAAKGLNGSHDDIEA